MVFAAPRTTLMAVIKLKMNKLSTFKYINILSPCLTQMQLALTTSLQLVVYICKQVTKQPLLMSPQLRQCFYEGKQCVYTMGQEAAHSYFKVKVAFLTLIASQSDTYIN